MTAQQTGHGSAEPFRAAGVERAPRPTRRLRARWLLGYGVAAVALLGGTVTAAAAGLLPMPTAEEIEIEAAPSMEFMFAVRPVLESVPDEYAFSYLTPEKRPVIGFTNKAVPAVMAAIESTGLDATIVEDAGFTKAQYQGRSDALIADLLETWPEGVPFPMIGIRPDLGLGVIGITRVTEDGTRDSTDLIEEIRVEAPFSIVIDRETVGTGTAG